MEAARATMVVSLVAALVIGACGGDEPVGDCPAGERIPARGGSGEQVIRTVGRLGGRPIAGVAVQVDDSEWKATDADGNATFDGVGSPFSVRVRQSFDEGTDRVWQLVGQTAIRWWSGWRVPEPITPPTSAGGCADCPGAPIRRWW
jgi:hypothetical protein